MTQDGKKAAQTLLARLDSCHTSPTVLYWLQLRKKTLSNTELGSELLRLCCELDVKSSPNADFFHVVNKAVGDFRPATSSFFCVDFKKDVVIAKYTKELQKRRAKASTSEPFAFMGGLMPFCFQCLRPKSEKNSHAFSGSLFFIFSSLEHGLRMIIDILSSGAYMHAGKLHEFSQVYEHRLGNRFLSDNVDSAVKDNRLSYLILDWEVEESRFDGRMSRDEIQSLCMEFPLWFYKRMHELHLVDEDAFVTGVLHIKFISHDAFVTGL
jgi:hypothetical protein